MFNLQLVSNTGTSSPIPGAADVYKAVPTARGGIIDVISDLKFTASDITPYLRNKIPFITLFEYDVEYNSTLASALYYTKGLDPGKNLTAAGSKLETFASTQIDTVKQSAFSKLNDITKSGINALGSTLKEIGDLSNEFSDPVLTPYNGLYLRNKTGFTYILPNFDNLKRNIDTGYASSSESLTKQSGFTDVVNASKELYEKAMGTALFASPGAFIEAPKFYNMPTDGENVEIKFDLINTIDSNTYEKHYDFLFLLAFQNTPYRKDIARIIPPKMYKCIIPGEQVFPYCYISKMDVGFKGNRRILNITNKINGNLTQAIIPDAYSIKLTIKSLNPSSGNFMVAGTNITVS